MLHSSWENYNTQPRKGYEMPQHVDVCVCVLNLLYSIVIIFFFQGQVCDCARL